MIDKILVTYASRTGSTTGIAETIAHTLAQEGLSVSLHPMTAVTTLDDYSAVVAGSAINNGAWLPEALQFIDRFQPQLARKPFAAFLVCMTLAMPNAGRYRSGVSDWLAPVRARVRPVSEGLFPGILDIARIPRLSDRLKFRASVALGAWKEGDHRDWQAVQQWAATLPPLLIVSPRP